MPPRANGFQLDPAAVMKPLRSAGNMPAPDQGRFSAAGGAHHLYEAVARQEPQQFVALAVAAEEEMRSP